MKIKINPEKWGYDWNFSHETVIITDDYFEIFDNYADYFRNRAISELNAAPDDEEEVFEYIRYLEKQFMNDCEILEL